MLGAANLHPSLSMADDPTPHSSKEGTKWQLQFYTGKN